MMIADALASNNHQAMDAGALASNKNQAISNRCAELTVVNIMESVELYNVIKIMSEPSNKLP